MSRVFKRARPVRVLAEKEKVMHPSRVPFEPKPNQPRVETRTPTPCPVGPNPNPILILILILPPGSRRAGVHPVPAASPTPPSGGGGGAAAAAAAAAGQAGREGERDSQPRGQHGQRRRFVPAGVLGGGIRRRRRRRRPRPPTSAAATSLRYVVGVVG